MNVDQTFGSCFLYGTHSVTYKFSNGACVTASGMEANTGLSLRREEQDEERGKKN